MISRRQIASATVLTLEQTGNKVLVASLADPTIITQTGSPLITLEGYTPTVVSAMRLWHTVAKLKNQKEFQEIKAV